MERRVGTISRGIRCPIIREGDNLVKIVTDSVLEAAEGEGRYRVLWQRLVNTVEWNPDPGIDIWDGGM